MRKLIVLCLIPFFVLSCGDLLQLGIDAAKTAGSITADLAFYYRFDGNTEDSSGNNRDGTHYGVNPFSHGELDRFGDTGSAVSFINTYMDTGWGSGLEVTGPLTVNFWIKAQGSAVAFPHAATQMHLFGVSRRIDPEDTPGLYLEIEPGAAYDMTVAICDQANTANLDTIRFNTVWDDIDLATWFMVTIVHEDGLGADKLHLYINNVEQTPDNTYSGLSYRVTLQDEIFLGASHIDDVVNGDTSDFEMDFMYIDDFRWFSRALTARERSALYYERDYIP